MVTSSAEGGKSQVSFLALLLARTGDCHMSVKIHTHKPGAVPKDFTAQPIFTTVNIAVDGKSQNDYIVVLLRKVDLSM